MSDEQQSPNENAPPQANAKERGQPHPDEQAEHEAAASAESRRGPAGEEVRNVSPRERRGMNRRQLLKLAPVIAVGAFAVTKWQEPLLMKGLHLSDWASGELFGRHRLARTFSNNDVAPFAKFPYNYYDVLDPDVDLDKWTLTVEGMVQRPGDYKLSQIQAFPKVVQNTRHVCVEGWDVIGNFGGTRASDFLRAVGADLSAKYLEVDLRGQLLRIDRHGDGAASADAVLLRDVRPAAGSRTRRAAAAADANQAWL